MIWQLSDVTHTTSSEDPGSLQATVDGASQVAVSKAARWEVLLLCRPSSGVSVPATTMTQAEGEDLVVAFDRESSTLFTRGENRKSTPSPRPLA